MPDDLTPHEPLKPQWFHILSALADRDRHGYGIQRDVLERTEGAMTLWPAMLYRSINGLVERGLIVPVDDPAGTAPDARRQYYRITAVGREALGAEAERLAQWADVARQRNTLGANSA